MEFINDSLYGGSIHIVYSVLLRFLSSENS